MFGYESQANRYNTNDARLLDLLQGLFYFFVDLFVVLLKNIFSSTRISETVGELECFELDLQPSISVHTIQPWEGARQKYLENNNLQPLIVRLLVTGAVGVLARELAGQEYKIAIVRRLQLLQQRGTTPLPPAKKTLPATCTVRPQSKDDEESSTEPDLQAAPDLAAHAERTDTDSEQEEEKCHAADLVATWRTQRRKVGLPYQDLTISKSTALSLLLWEK